MSRYEKNMKSMSRTTAFFGVFLIFTDIFFLIVARIGKMPLMEYVVYFKLVVNSINLYIIYKRHYITANLIIHFIITGFMVIGVACMGIAPGFQLYSLGMIACSGYTSYLCNRLYGKGMPVIPMLTFHVVSYTIACVYNRLAGQLYETSTGMENIMLFFNSVASLGFAIVYIMLFYNNSVATEKKLEKVALEDKLTGLYNRHYLLARMEAIPVSERSGYWLAILDIDDFKKVNDVYGHNCGDYVLRRVADEAKSVCSDCKVCRWGGEEFVILGMRSEVSEDVLEKLRGNIAKIVFEYEEKRLSVTVTIGVSGFSPEYTTDTWVSAADKNLYIGKQSGKNRVVSEVIDPQ